MPPRASLILEHSVLVRRIAHLILRWLPSNVEIEDLVQAGTVGLIEAANHYVASMGASFETYATIRIRGAMLDSLRKDNWAPRRLYRQLRQIKAARWLIEQQTSAAARPSAVAATLGLSLETYHRIEQEAAACRHVSADEVCPGKSTSLCDDEPAKCGDPAAEVEQESLRQVLAAAIDALPERERTVLLLYYDEELCLREIGDKLKVSESRVCQICKAAVDQLALIAQSWMDNDIRLVR